LVLEIEAIAQEFGRPGSGPSPPSCSPQGWASGERPQGQRASRFSGAARVAA